MINKIKNEDHIAALDIMRGIAALLVVFAHGNGSNLLWSGPSTGPVGVAIFFSLSGFLMGYLYSNKNFCSTEVYKYCVSRFSRLAPAYLIIIIFSYLMFNFIDKDYGYQINNSNILRHLLFSGNASVFWSIPPEVQFYGFFILIWYSINKLNLNIITPIVLITVCVIVMIAIRDKVPGTTLPSKIDLFILGCMSGVLRKSKKFDTFTIKNSTKLITATLTIFYGVYLQNLNPDSSIYQFIHYSFVCAFCMLVLSIKCIDINNTSIKKFFILIGKISFTLYLIHTIIIHYYMKFNLGLPAFIHMLLIFSLCLLISYNFYYFLENPLNHKIKTVLSNKLLK